MTARALIVGAGLMGRWHAHALGRIDARIVGVVDPDLAAARGIAEGAPVWRDPSEALQTVQPDVVHICTSAAHHVEQVAMALRSGAHVLVEKPAAPSVAQTEELLRLAQQSSLTLTPVHQMSFQPWMQDVPQAGRLLAIEHVLHSAGAGPDDDADAIAASILVHPLSVFERLLPRGALDGVTWSVARTGPGELRGLGSAGDCALQFTVSMSGRPPRNDLVVSGAEATLHADLFHGFGAVDSTGAGRVGKAARPFSRAVATLGRAGVNLSRRALQREPAFPGLAALFAATYDAVAQGRPSPLPPHHVLSVARARAAILAAP